MRFLIVALASAACLSSATQASADRLKCPAHPRHQWIPIESAVSKAEALGYRVFSTKADDGCWKIKAFDRNGAKVEILLDPASGEPVRSGHSR